MCNGAIEFLIQQLNSHNKPFEKNKMLTWIQQTFQHVEKQKIRPTSDICQLVNEKE